MTSITVTVSRDELGLGPLQIGPNNNGTYLLIDDGVELPSVRWSREYATHRHIRGGTLASATQQITEITHEILVRGTGSAHKKAAQQVLAAAFSQFQYTLTETYDSEGSEVWSADPADILWVPSRALRANFHALARITVPVNPKAI